MLFKNRKINSLIVCTIVTILIFHISISALNTNLGYYDLLEIRNQQLSNKEFTPSEYGLYVNSGGVIMKDGKPYRGHGVNYFSLFYDLLGWNAPYRANLQVLKDHNIPFVRFAACGYWPKDFDLYFNSKERYFTLMDNVVKAAEDLGIGLIPSLFWYTASVPDLMDEPRNAWGDVNSKTHKFMRQYTKEIVTRYKDSPAIWGWEFGNEYNLEVDIPNPESHRPPIRTDLGTRSSRDERDDMTTEMMLIAYLEFAKVVQKYDPHRMITTGNGGIRPSAWNMKENRTWNQDNTFQHKTMILLSNPFPYDVLSIHLYHNVFGEQSMPDTKLNVFNGKYSIEYYVQWLANLSVEMKMPLFIGEWGSPEINPASDTKQLFMEKLNAIEKAKVPVSAMWVYSLVTQNDTWSVTANNSRSYMLKELQKLNLKILEEESQIIPTTGVTPAISVAPTAKPTITPADNTESSIYSFEETYLSSNELSFEDSYTSKDEITSDETSPEINSSIYKSSSDSINSDSLQGDMETDKDEIDNKNNNQVLILTLIAIFVLAGSGLIYYIKFHRKTSN